MPNDMMQFILDALMSATDEDVNTVHHVDSRFRDEVGNHVYVEAWGRDWKISVTAVDDEHEFRSMIEEAKSNPPK